MTSSEEPTEAILSVNKYVVYSLRQTGCKSPVLLKHNMDGILFFMVHGSISLEERT